MLFCLTVLAFLYRSVIPVGYMPDFSGQQGGSFTITLCTPGGNTTSVLSLDTPDETGKASSQDALSSQDCPYGMVLSQVSLPGQATLVLERALPHRPLLVAIRNQALPPLPALGPPLGSRAPPSNLG